MHDLLDRTDRMPPRFDDTLPVNVAPVTPLATSRAARGTRPMRPVPPPIPPRALRGRTGDWPDSLVLRAPTPEAQTTPLALPVPPVLSTSHPIDGAARRRIRFTVAIVACLVATLVLLSIGAWIVRSRGESERPGGLVRPITTTPPGATVTLVDDGRATVIGPTPLAVSIDRARAYDLVFSMRGFATTIYHVAPNSTEPVVIDLVTTATAR